MASFESDYVRKQYPGNSDEESAKLLAQESNYFAVVKYKRAPEEKEFTNFASCDSERDISRYLYNPNIYETEIIFIKDGPVVNLLSPTYIKMDFGETDNELKSEGIIPDKEAHKWYSTSENSIEQIVIEIPAGIEHQSELKGVSISSECINLVEQPLSVGFCPSKVKKGPYLMIRTDNYVKLMKESNLTIAFAYCKMPSGGLFGIYVESDVTKKHFNIPFMEGGGGLDMYPYITLIQHAFKKTTLDICLADGHGETVEKSPMGTIGSWGLIYGEYDISIFLEEDLKSILRNKFNELFQYHKSLSNRNFQSSMNELYQLVPIDRSPILKKK